MTATAGRVGKRSCCGRRCGSASATSPHASGLVCERSTSGKHGRRTSLRGHTCKKCWTPPLPAPLMRGKPGSLPRHALRCVSTRSHNYQGRPSEVRCCRSWSSRLVLVPFNADAARDDLHRRVDSLVTDEHSVVWHSVSG
jgi:hypothetical protein